MNDDIDVKELMIKDSEVYNNYIENSTASAEDDSDDHIVLMDQSGYAEVRAADDPRFGEDWRDY